MRAVHSKVEPYDVYIGRPSRWGNPFSHSSESAAPVFVNTREEAIRCYEQWLFGGQQLIHDRLKLVRPTMDEIRDQLEAKVLGCWCKPADCHGDVLAQIANVGREEPIDIFRGPFRFLSNFYAATVKLPDGELAPSAEHAYVWHKLREPADRMWAMMAFKAADVKKIGRTRPIRLDWNEVKLQVMEDVVREKFTRHHELAKRLILTADRSLIEGNTWGDNFWGVCEGRGMNHLGKILMKVRQELGAVV